MTTFKRIDHIALHVKDLQNSTDFYQRNFGFKSHYIQVTPKGIKINYLKLADTILELVDDDSTSMNGFHWCIETYDFDLAIKQLHKGGVKMIQAPHRTDPRESKEEGWRRAVFVGPDKEQIEIRG